MTEVEIKEVNFIPIIKGLVDLVADFPTYEVTARSNLGEVTNDVTVLRKKSVEKPQKWVRRYWWEKAPYEPENYRRLDDSDVLEKTQINLYRDETFEIVDVNEPEEKTETEIPLPKLHKTKTVNVVKLRAHITTAPNYNKTLMDCITRNLQVQNFKVKIDINS